MEILSRLKQKNKNNPIIQDEKFFIPEGQILQIKQLIEIYGFTGSINRAIVNFITYGVTDNLVERYKKSLSLHNSSLDYYILMYGDHGEQRHRERKENAKNAVIKSKKGRKDMLPSQIGYWIKRGYSEHDAMDKVSSFSRRDRDYFIEKYGMELGTKRYDDMISKRKTAYDEIKNSPNYDEYKKNKATSLENFMKKYGKEEGQKKWDAVCQGRKGRNTITDYISRYGEIDGVVKYNDYVKTITNNIDNFVRLYGEEEGLRRYNDRKRSMQGMFTYDWFVKKYGEETAANRYKEHWGKRLKNVCVASDTSRKLFDPLFSWCQSKSWVIYYGTDDNTEYFLYDKETHHIYFYDFTILDKKLIIEYHGEHCHPNPNLSSEDWMNWRNVYAKTITADEQHKYDLRKKQIAEENGFTYVVIWSSDNMEESIQKCQILLE